jgi:pimeloyl-ACP methyl ester carboxylesterase
MFRVPCSFGHWIRLSLCVLTLGQVAVAQTPQTINFATEDDITIVGDFVPAEATGDKTVKAPLVILLHMYRHDRSTWRPLVPTLHERGYAIMAIDVRGHGASVGPPGKKFAERVVKRDARLFRAMHRDVQAAYQWASAERDDVDLTRVALVGASVGCSIAIDYAARDKSVDVVVCLSPGVDYLGVDTVTHLADYGDRPILLLASDEEKAGPETIAKQAGGAEVKLFRQPGHGTRLFEKVRTLPTEIADFLDGHVGEPAEHPVVASYKSKSGVYHKPGTGFANRISDKNKRWFSSAEEAESRGMRPVKRGGG